MSDPRATFDADQSIAAFVNMGGCFAAMYRGLIEGGLQPSQALPVVVAYARGMGASLTGDNYRDNRGGPR
jgi:hypothetical protein